MPRAPAGDPRVYGPYEHGDRFRVHVVTRRGGKRTATYQTFETRELADAFATGARDEAQGRTVGQAIEAFLEAKRVKGLAPATIESDEDRLQMLLGKLTGRPIRAVVGHGAELYAAAQVGRAPDTHRNALTVAKDWGRWCVKQRWLRANPFGDVDPVGRKTYGADKPRLTVDESRKLQAHCHATAAGDPGAVLTLAYLLLGPRASELVKRDVRDLDDGGRLLWIGATKTKAGRRRLLVPGEIVPLLVEIAAGRAGDAPLFVSASGKRWSRFVARDHVRRVCAAARVPVLPPQALRRTQATLATDAGATGLMVAEHLGHATHAAPAVTGRAYVGRDAAGDAQAGRALRVITGGKR